MRTSSPCSVHLDARPKHARNIIQPFRVFMISCVACILMHDRFPSRAFFYSCNKLHATILLFSRLLMAHASQRVPIIDWYKRHALGNARHQNGLFHIVACILMHDRHIPSVIPCSVQLVARKNLERNVIILCVACILMHDRIAHKTFLFRA